MPVQVATHDAHLVRTVHEGVQKPKRESAEIGYAIERAAGLNTKYEEWPSQGDADLSAYQCHIHIAPGKEPTMSSKTAPILPSTL
jgi:hypothetical protein